MRGAYAVLGILFLILIGGAFFAANKAGAPDITPLTDGSLPSPMPMSDFILQSPAFSEDGFIPSKFTCDGANVNPELSWSGVPDGTVSFALIMDDPDIPESVKSSRGIEAFDHWVVFNVPENTRHIGEDEVPAGVQGSNTSGENAYTGPCPPDREHRYIFVLYALDTKLSLPTGTSKDEVLSAIEGHILGEARLMGRYNRPQNL